MVGVETVKCAAAQEVTMRYAMEDGTVVDTDRATQYWTERTDFDGRNYVGRITRDQGRGQTLYRTRRRRYWLEHHSVWPGEQGWAEWLSPERAAAWLDRNEYEIPADLLDAAEHVIE